jgi:hypothetical protein
MLFFFCSKQNYLLSLICILYTFCFCSKNIVLLGLILVALYFFFVPYIPNIISRLVYFSLSEFCFGQFIFIPKILFTYSSYAYTLCFGRFIFIPKILFT